MKSPRFDLTGFGDGGVTIVGESASMRALHGLIEKVAQSDCSVVISGETGTGKELVARRIHGLSARARGPFVPVNCGAIPKEIVESVLFGHTKGSFTGALRDQLGVIPAANGGTLFLDEVSQMPHDIQVKLLRVLQDHKVVSVGATKPNDVDVRVVAATNIDLAEYVKATLFRADLYYRLNVVQIALPPLRERGDDIPLLVEHILGRLNVHKRGFTVSSDAMTYLLAYQWPGNVRELENVLERAVVLLPSAQTQIVPADFPEHICNVSVSTATAVPRVETVKWNRTVDEVIRDHVLLVLRQVGGNKSRAQDILGVSRQTIKNWLNDWGATGGGRKEDQEPPTLEIVES